MDLLTLGFETNYRIAEWLPSIEGTRVYQFGPTGLVSTAAVTTSVPLPHRVITVEPAGTDRWIGIFSASAGGRLSGAFATPDPDTVAIVVSGRGFWVPVRTPADFGVMRPSLIDQVLRVPDNPMSIVVGSTRLAAYGRSGLLWFTNDISWDGLDIEEIDSLSVRGRAWDSPAGRSLPFRVDLATGTCEGGAPPHSIRS